MQTTPLLLLRPHSTRLFSPLNLAAFATWAAAAYGPLSQLLSATPAWTLPTALGTGGLITLPLLCAARPLMQKLGAPLGWLRLNMLTQAVCALLACWAFHDGMQPILLAIVTSQLMLVFSVSAVIPLLVVINAVATWMLVKFGVGGASTQMSLQIAAAYLGLQAFTVILWVMIQRAEEARLESLRINAQLMATRQLLEEGARAEERLRLSRELHDVAGHKLTAMKLQLALSRQTPDALPGVIEDCSRLADELLTDIRGVVSALRSHEGVDLQRALRALDPALPRPTVSFELDPDLRIADMRRAEALLRCAQEGLTNALRHADAATVRVSLRQEAAGVVLTVEDDGRGRVAQVRAGNGLRGIRERLEEAGGHLELRDRAPSGLVLRTILPAAKPAAGAANVQTRAESAHYCLLKAAAAALQANHGHAGQSAG